MTGSLASVHPELIPEWSEKNLPLTPDKITFGSNKRVWWKGACGHEWETSVKARSKGEKCPICSGARVIEGINDLATLKPLLAQEWSKKNKLKPTEVSVASHKKIIWKCKHGHEWEASVKSRTVNGTGCPYCSHNKVLAGFNDLASQYNAVLECVSSAHPLRSKILSYYNSMVTSVQNHTKVPSFCTRSSGSAKVNELEWNGSKYVATLTDTNGVLGNYNFSANIDGVSFSVSGNKLTVSMDKAPSKEFTITAAKKERSPQRCSCMV